MPNFFDIKIQNRKIIILFKIIHSFRILRHGYDFFFIDFARKLFFNCNNVTH